jgi:hypothetical protein
MNPNPHRSFKSSAGSSLFNAKISTGMDISTIAGKLQPGERGWGGELTA